MIVIDIAQRAAARRYDFQPGYGRRYDTDKPGKPWRQENDGPRADRQGKSDERREALKRKAFTPSPQPPQHGPMLSKAERFERNVARCFQAIGNGKHILSEISPVLGVGIDRTRDFCDALVKRGLITKNLVRWDGVSCSFFDLSDAGRTVWEARQC